ncbi:MAG: phosphotransferase enzyme family protein [Huintestinicola sp.]|uniref:phosphotransferase enzyme family protein n=1 Tax=Huintestinicola sp. TaxID=2981661 RepID=UPI003F0721BE
MDKLLKKMYGLNVTELEHSANGAGSETFFADCDEGKFVVKFPSTSEMNDPCAEPALCEYLQEKGISVCRFIKNKNGEYISTDEKGRLFHVQEYIRGQVLDWNTAPPSILRDSAETLGRIHAALKDHSGLQAGIGEDFFRYMTPENALRSYENTLVTAEARRDEKTVCDLRYRIGMIKRFPGFTLDLDRLTLTPTHGDYFISQLICSENRIKAVIDWTTACVHPAIWEIVRSYVYAAPECARGEISPEGLTAYFSHYLSFSELNRYDIKMSVKLFYYQLAVCDYYAQYYASEARNSVIYLRQAEFSTALLRWFEKNEEMLTEHLENNLRS